MKNKWTEEEKKRMDEIEGPEVAERARKFMETTVENTYLRAENKHVFRLGVMQLEILPVGTTDLPGLFKEIREFAKLMKELHGDKHLVATFDMGEAAPQGRELVEEMFQ